MTTNPNFPPIDAPPLDDVRSQTDMTQAPAGRVVSEEEVVSEEGSAKPHDPEKFGAYTLPPDFLKEALSEPLPRAKEEDLAHNTLAPYREGGEVYQRIMGEGSSGGRKKEQDTLPDAPRAKADSESVLESARARKQKNRILLAVAGLLSGCFVIGGVIARSGGADEEPEVEVLNLQTPEKPQSTIPEGKGSAEAMEAPEDEAMDAAKMDAKVDAPSTSDSTAKPDPSKGVSSAAAPKVQQKSQSPAKGALNPEASERKSSEKVNPSPQPAGSKGSATIPVYDLK